MSISEVLHQCPPGNAGLQPGSGSHAGAWRSQGKPWELAVYVQNRHLVLRPGAAHGSLPRQFGAGKCCA
jgi:hypothetical protein